MLLTKLRLQNQGKSVSTTASRQNVIWLIISFQQRILRFHKIVINSNNILNYERTFGTRRPREVNIFSEWCKFIFEVYCYPTVRISVHSRQYRHSSVQLCVITKQLRRLSFFKWRGRFKELGSSSWAYSGASMYNWWTDGFWKEVNKRKKTSSCLEQPFLVAEVNEKRNKKSFEAAAGNLLAAQCCLLPHSSL